MACETEQIKEQAAKQLEAAAEKLGDSRTDSVESEPPTSEPPRSTPASVPPELESRLAEVLRGDVFSFQLFQLDVDALSMGLETGTLVQPLVDEQNKLLEEELEVRRIQLRAPEHTRGILRSGPLTKPETRTVPLPPERNYLLGECSREEYRNQTDKISERAIVCGSLSILDADGSMISGIVVHPKIGTTFFEPVDQLLGGQSYPHWHLAYNIRGTHPVIFSEEEVPRGSADINSSQRTFHKLASPLPDFTFKGTSIVLDGDVRFYNINTSTVWARQEAAHLAVWLIYLLIEPLSSADWGLDIPIKGQEVWISGGPTTTDGDNLINEITDPNYFLLNSITDTELHYLFVGYSVTDLYGKAAGIGTDSGGFGGGAQRNHAFGDGRSSSSLKTRWVVMAHEVGHLIGGRHSDGVTSGCAGGGLSSLCGASLMPAGSAGSPEIRSAYFSDANDDNISAVLGGLP